MKKYYALYKKQFILGPAFKLAEAILELLVPLVMAKIIDVGIKNGDVPYIIKMGLLMASLGILGLLCAIVCQYSAAVAQQGVGTEIRNDMFKKINSFAQSDIDAFSSSSLITRITNDVNQIQSGVAMFIRLMFRSPFLIAGSLIMAMKLDLKMSIIFFAAGLLVSLIMYYVLTKSLPLYKVIQKVLDKVSLVVKENLSGVRVIRAFSKSNHEKERFGDKNDELTRINFRVGSLSALLNPMTFAVMNLAIVILLYFGGKNVYSGELSQGKIIALISYMTQILLSIIVFANVIVVFTKALASVQRVKEVLDAEPSIKDDDAAYQNGDEAATAVEFIDVSYAFPKSDENALSNISFTAEKGETIGIIGGTGAGKSTLVNLIPRFSDVKNGSVKVFGHDVRDCKFGYLRHVIHVVPQKSNLFSGTIKDNLLMGDRSADDRDIDFALKVSQSAEFVSKLKDGTNTLIEEKSKNLSGGQKQRLCIARAIMGHPRILIFDDSSSALDFATDAALRKALKENLNDTTVFLVSQRVNTVKNADKILVLDDGELVATGTHKELYKTNEVYRDICLSQLSEKEVASV